jgi:hypothetical protein
MKAVKKASTGAIVNGDPKFTKTKTKKKGGEKKETPKSFTMTVTPKDPKMNLPGMTKVLQELGLVAGGKDTMAFTKTKKKKS